MFLKNISHWLLLAILAGAVALASYFGGGTKSLPHLGAQPAHEQQAAATTAAQFIITDQRRTHILYGDHTGGGHKFGAGKPGKTEFPKSWDDEKIISTALAIANDATIEMRPSGRYWLKAKDVDGLPVRVVLDKEKGEVVTTYPLNGKRNSR